MYSRPCERTYGGDDRAQKSLDEENVTLRTKLTEKDAELSRVNSELVRLQTELMKVQNELEKAKEALQRAQAELEHERANGSRKDTGWDKPSGMSALGGGNHGDSDIAELVF